MKKATRKATSDTYSHPTTYREIVAQAMKQHYTRLAALDDAADWIRKIEGDLQKVVAMGCLFSIREGSLELLSQVVTEVSGSRRTFRALRISSGWMSDNDVRLIEAFISIGWVVEAANVASEYIFGTAILWKPGTDIRISITAPTEYLAQFRAIPESDTPAVEDTTPSSHTPTAI